MSSEGLTTRDILLSEERAKNAKLKAELKQLEQSSNQKIEQLRSDIEFLQLYKKFYFLVYPENNKEPESIQQDEDEKEKSTKEVEETKITIENDNKTKEGSKPLKRRVKGTQPKSKDSSTKSRGNTSQRKNVPLKLPQQYKENDFGDVNTVQQKTLRSSFKPRRKASVQSKSKQHTRPNSSKSIKEIDLFKAAHNQDSKLIIDYLNQGHDPNIVPSNTCHSLLQIVAYQGMLDAVECFIAKKADVNFLATDGTTPLIYAIEGNNPKVVEALINAGADVNACVGERKFTPLHYAVACSNSAGVQIVHLLMEKGANPRAKTINGKTPYDYAKLPEVKKLVWVDNRDQKHPIDKVQSMPYIDRSKH